MRKQCVPGLSSGGRGLGMRLECKICLIELYTMFNRIYDAIMKHLGFSSILIACQISLKYTIWVTHTCIKDPYIFILLNRLRTGTAAATWTTLERGENDIDVQ